MHRDCATSPTGPSGRTLPTLVNAGRRSSQPLLSHPLLLYFGKCPNEQE
jgi:hypothetical protein